MQNEIKSGIYCIENITTNKKYIGQSIDINDRWRKHISELNHSSHHNDYLQKAWNKYGENDFKFYVLEYCSDDELDEKEIYYINLYNTIDRKYGYNLKTGGQANCHHTDEVKNKISESNKKAYQNQELRYIRLLPILCRYFLYLKHRYFLFLHKRCLSACFRSFDIAARLHQLSRH